MEHKHDMPKSDDDYHERINNDIIRCSSTSTFTFNYSNR
jgi:hypothetical protein